MVGQQILALPVGVRIPAPQPDCVRGMAVLGMPLFFRQKIYGSASPPNFKVSKFAHECRPYRYFDRHRSGLIGLSIVFDPAAGRQGANGHATCYPPWVRPANSYPANGDAGAANPRNHSLRRQRADQGIL